MKVMRAVSTIIILVSISGCSAYFKRSIDTVHHEKTKEHIGTVIVWANDTNAAILNKDGKVCMQNALAIKTTNSTADVKLSEALLKLSKVEEKNLEASPSENNEALLSVTSSIKQAATLLTTTTERTSFLNTGMFYLCQILSNSHIRDEDAKLILEQLVVSAAGLGKNDVEKKTDTKKE